MKLKVLHVVNHFWPCVGGVESVVLNLCNGLIAKGHYCSVVCLNKCAYSNQKLKEKETLKNGLEIYRLPFLDLRYYKIAPKVLEFAKKADIVHVHGIGFFSDFLLLSKPLHKKPFVVSTHGAIFHTKKLSALKKTYFFNWCKMLLKNSDRIIAVSKNDLELFKKISKKVELIENGVEVEKFSKVKRKKNAEQLIYFGRISKNKGIAKLIETMAFIVKENPKAKLLIIGEDWEGIRKELEKKAKEKGLEKNIKFLGKAEDKKLLEYLGAARFFVSASEYEGFGLTLIEAMSAGLIPIVSNIESFKNLVENGKNGFLVDFGKPELAARIIQKIMKKKQAELSKISRNAREEAKKYSWKEKVKQFEKIYFEVVKEKRK